MAEKQDKEQKTEEPTGKRLQKARDDGQVVRSNDLVFAFMLLSMAGLLLLFGGGVFAAFRHVLFKAGDILDSAAVTDAPLFAVTILRSATDALLPFYLALFPVAALASIIQVGFYFVPAKLRPKPAKLVPKLSIDKFVNGRSMIETLTSILKLVLLVAAYVMAVWFELPRLMETDSLLQIAKTGVWLVVKLLVYIGCTLLFIGLIDFSMRKWDMMRQLKMTKEEVKQEVKDAVGDPEVKARIKARQRQMAIQRMMDEVPSATVVVTNPTHYAIAIKYMMDMSAPRVVAKGRDFVAERIRELAREAGVPIFENPPLARALHDSVQPGEEIPPTLYKAVAEVLAAVMKTRRRVGRMA